MTARRPHLLPVLLVCILVAAILPPSASADIVVELTVHETPDGPPTTTVTTCSFFVKGVGLLAQTGMVRIFLPQSQGSPIELANAAFDGVQNVDGLFNIAVGPIDVGASYVGLFAVVDYSNEALPDLFGSAFQVQCPEPPVDLHACVISSFLPPLGTPGHARGEGGERFKLGQTIPIKADVSCPDGDPSSPPRIFVAKANGDALGDEQPGTSKSSAFTENILRRNGNHWQYNLDTSRLTSGLWRIRIDVGDGSEHAVWVQLR